MEQEKVIKIEYFSDILCIWAYIAQQKMDKLKQEFSNKIEVSEHFLPVFGAVDKKMHDNWQSKGGVSAYSQHVKEVANDYKDVYVAKNVWLKNTPTSSINSHIFIKAAEISLKNQGGSSEEISSKLSELIWQVRVSFFKNTVDVSNIKELLTIATSIGLKANEIPLIIGSGEAVAALDKDRQIKEQYDLKGSPSLIINEGRQILYGNVSYEVIAANVSALLQSD